ncbi:hypothetical protein ABAC460_00590 [Asticcacaulis sp. AC460]|uniref:surface-adhesin E family protein n=1 Tax=Asticcacaulis sp. AC460 TaxID=1282360 RepID=UPI0003C3B6FF|nr:surface-adhesin E family protein [Asticcacaulis sp. AC460]ESQ93599.1 hypothetical protein ABAC460_00590 [Asticcacaulis sp. AC460]
MKQIVIAALALAAVAAAPAYSKDFIFVHNGQSDLRFIDRASITRVDATTMSAWYVVIFEDAAVVDNVKQSQAQFHVRCDSKQWAVKAGNTFDHAGKSLETVSVADSDLTFAPAAPDTVIGRVADYVCGTRPVDPADVYAADDAWHLQSAYDRLKATPAP